MDGLLSMKCQKGKYIKNYHLRICCVDIAYNCGKFKVKHTSIFTTCTIESKYCTGKSKSIALKRSQMVVVVVVVGFFFS